MNLISIFDTKDYIHDTLGRAIDLKRGEPGRSLSLKTLGLLFEKASTRTRVSFEVAMSQLGGHSLYLNPRDTQVGRGEAIRDTALTLERYLDAVAIRSRTHETVEGYAGLSSIPVINALTDREHPCQALADLMTIKERFGGLRGVKVAFVGDGNNVCNSLIGGSALVGIDLAVATPIGYEPDGEILRAAEKIKGSKITLTNDPQEAVSQAQVIYTDVWVSMGQESSAEKRLKDFRGFQVNDELLRHSKDALVMHCLPAKRGVEITDSVLDGPRSIVFDQAENRLHVQKAILEMVIK